MNDNSNIVYAPLVVFAYNRAQRLNDCLTALSQNDGAKETELYIFCDGAKPNTDSNDVLNTQRLAKDEKWKDCFKSVTVECQQKNRGLAKSVIAGVTEVLEQSGRCIVVEDDLVVTSKFLKYMNKSLEFYKDDTRIWSISGFTFPLKSLHDYEYDVYLSYRMSSHGWGMWLDRWQQIDWNVSDYKELFYKPWKARRFRRGGNDLFRMLRRQMQGKRDSWAIRACYAQSRADKLTIYPRESFIQNNGYGGDGTHCESGSVFSELHLEGHGPDLEPASIEINKKITREFKSLYRVTFSEAVECAKNKAKKLFKR